SREVSGPRASALSTGESSEQRVRDSGGSSVGSALARGWKAEGSDGGLGASREVSGPRASALSTGESSEQRVRNSGGSSVGSALARGQKAEGSDGGLGVSREASGPRASALSTGADVGSQELFPTTAVYWAGEDGEGYEASQSEESGRAQATAPDVFVVADRSEFLRGLPLQVAEPSAHVAEILKGWGVRTLGELTALSKADVTQRLGTEGLLLWERAAGEVTRPLKLITPPQTFTAEITLEHEIETLEPLLFVLRRFIDRLALELRNAGFVAGELLLELKLEDETVYTRAFRLPEPTAQESILFRVLHTHLESLHTETAVCGASLECRPVRPLARQQGLFESALRDPHGFAETLARVAAVVGAKHLGTPMLENSHRTDAVKLVTPANVVLPAEKPALHPPRGLPLRRYRSPLSATVELSGPSPVFVWTGPIQGAVRALAGPWQGSSEWWDASRVWLREEWDAELETGGVYRLLRTPEGWFVEGEYD
ncbi:MAG: hypothetical protein ABIV50_15865, partial [Opitutus sp.]